MEAADKELVECFCGISGLPLSLRLATVEGGGSAGAAAETGPCEIPRSIESLLTTAHASPVSRAAAAKPRPGLAIDWDAQPLGQVSDAEIAGLLGVHYAVVRRARRQRGIGRWRSNPAWAKQRKRLQEQRRRDRARRQDGPTKKIDWAALPLGKLSDTQIARELGMAVSTVARARARLGIRVWNDGRMRGVDWDAQPLGQVPDRELAARLGTVVETVRYERRLRGIAPKLRHVAFDAATAKLIVQVREVHGRIDWDAQPLGRMPDAAIARALGVTRSAVGLARRGRGIEHFDPGPIPRRDNIDWDAQSLGQVSDLEIAKQLRVPRIVVYRERERRGLAPWDSDA